MSLVAGISSTLAARHQRATESFAKPGGKDAAAEPCGPAAAGRQTAEQIGELAARCLSDLLQLPACFYLSADGQAPIVYGAGNSVCQKLEDAAVRTVFPAIDRPAGAVICTGDAPTAISRFLPVRECLRLRASSCRKSRTRRAMSFLQLLLSQFAMALERQRLSDERHQMAVEKQKRADTRQPAACHFS